MYLFKTPKFVKEVFPSLIWDMPKGEQTIYLTFDDGPHPEITPWVLKQLEQYNAKATFFCVGENVEKYPEVFDLIKQSQHRVGSHTYHHLNGWATENPTYFKNVRKAAALCDSDLFRPPYGRIKPAQAQFLSRFYRIIMWDVLSGDFDRSLTGQQCWDRGCKYIQDGSIVVFHDSEKAKDRLYEVLPRVLEHYAGLNFRFMSIE